MLDELLGRADLKARIDALETELERAENRLAAESERRADAVTAKQDAEERCNRLEDRIASLEGELERVRSDAPDLAFRGVETIAGSRLDTVLHRLESIDAGPEGALTAVITDDVPDEATDAFGDRAPLLDRAAPCVAVTDDAGLVSAAIVPVITPDPFATWSDRFTLDRSWFQPTEAFTFALVRSDLFAMGTYDGDDRTAFTGFTSDVKSDHGKGGFSQGRFERRRDAQIDEHLDACHDAIAERTHDRLIVVGEHTVLSSFRDDAEQTATVDATGDPEPALDRAFRSFFSTRLYRL